MTGPVTWDHAGKDDVEELCDFVCSPRPPHMAIPKHRKYAGAYWERVVQSGLRRIPWPIPGTDVVVVGRDREGVVAVSWSFEMGGPDEYKILAAAVALRARRQRLGDALMQQTLQRLIGRADDAHVAELALHGLIHKRNAASQAMAGRNGFIYIGDEDGDHQHWWHPPIHIEWS